jgi:hypothetical protein
MPVLPLKIGSKPDLPEFVTKSIAFTEKDF